MIFRRTLPSLLASALLLFASCETADPVAAEPESVETLKPGLPGSFEVVGRGPVTGTHTSDIWVFQGVDGRDYAYTGTWGACAGCYGNRMYAWDVSDPSSPVLTDSVVVDARVVNDVKVNAAGTVAVITREGASSRLNGIVILDLADPAHPKVAAEYTDALSGGVHNTFIDGDIVYAVNNGTRDIHVIDIADPFSPQQRARWGIPDAPNKYLHDVWVDDGIAYVSYWDDGLVLLDVGNGIRSGSIDDPQPISQISYVTTLQGSSYGNTHTALPYTNRAGNSYVFVGDEIFPPGFNIRSPGSQPGGFVHVIDVTDPLKPAEVAKYEVPGAGVHNLWIEDDILYTAYYNAGLRALDVSGKLQGDLGLQSREIATLATTDGNAFIRNRPFTWGPQAYKGLVYASDHNSGLWIARLRKTTPSANVYR